ncbi:MAG TPA: hypothetical protein VKP78_05710 [bacterium]|nr:hypothetical protein [bacterium]
MEYLLTNLNIDADKFRGLFYKGDFHRIERHLVLKEGYFARRKYDSQKHETVLSDHPAGIYNLIIYDPEKNLVTATNDHLGKMPLFYYLDGENFLLSNQPWKIIRNLTGDLSIDEERLRDQLYYYTIPSESETYIKNLNKVPAATTLQIDLDDLSISTQKYWKMRYDFSKEKYDEETALEKFDQDLHDFFDRLLELHPAAKFGFGNSGGLDSRLVAVYAREHGFDIQGYTICNEKSRFGLNSVTYQNAKNIAGYFGFKNEVINYRPQSYDNRFLLDIRNNPFGISQFFKNPNYNLPEFEVLITGQPGSLVGDHWGSYLESNDKEYAYRYFRYYFEKHRAFKNRAMKLFGKIFDSKRLYKNRSVLSKIVKPAYDRIKEYLGNSPNQSFLNQYMYFYHNILSRYGFNGGFESVNRTKKTYYLFYPFALDNSLRWKRDFFYNRYLLKKLIARKNPFLADLRDTNLKRINEKSNPAVRLFSRIELQARSTGIHFPNWVKDPQYVNHYQKIMQRPNLIFDKVVNKDLILERKLYRDMNAGGDFLKTKMILNIIANQEYSRLDKDDFMIH